MERAPDECLGVLLDADAVSKNQFIEVPGEQLLERAPGQLPVGEGKPNIERHTALRRCNPGELEERITQRLALRGWMVLDEIAEDHGARLPVEKLDLVYEQVASENEVIGIICPALRRQIAENARERQTFELVRDPRRRPQLGLGK
jgi:hypothetical protein